ncbi:MAG: NAD(P)/FAD-dependent oxidoreductase, partial [Desulfobacterales bacterium]|nr:NAD(P)/FAD-dependent oxidoreductase [Desulfobacterales bacterium]
MAKETYDVIVIGAGFGGSTCAALLAKRGLKVLLLEKNAKAGGKAMPFSKNGFTYNGWAIIAAPIQENMFEKVLIELEMENEVELVTPDGSGGSIYKNPEGTYVPMPPMDAEAGPDPEIIFDWLGVEADKRENALNAMTAITLMPPQDIDRLDDTTFEEFLKPYDIPEPVYAYLLSLMHDMCFVAPVDAVAASEAVQTLQSIFLRSGGLFARGGIGRVAETFARAVEENNGKVIMGARVEKIIVEQGKVTGVSTNKGNFNASIVVSNAGIQPTALKLVGEEHFDRSYINYVKELVPSVGLPGIRYFLDKKVIQPAFGAIFSNNSYWTMDSYLKAAAGEMPEDIGVLYEVPSNYDEGAAPEGKQVILAAVWGPAEGLSTKEDMKPWWDKCEEIMFNAFPDLPAHIERREPYSSRDVSVLTRDRVLPNQGGECIGLAQVVGQGGGRKPST